MVFVFTILSYLYFMKSVHPLSSALLLVVTSCMVASNAGMMVSKWVMATIFLIFLGGMMVMFLYVCTLSMNEKFLYYKKLNLLLGAILLGVFSDVFVQEKVWVKQINLIYLNTWNFGILFFVGYLIMVLLLCVKCAQSFKGALMKSW